MYRLVVNAGYTAKEVIVYKLRTLEKGTAGRLDGSSPSIQFVDFDFGVVRPTRTTEDGNLSLISWWHGKRVVEGFHGTSALKVHGLCCPRKRVNLR
ncbi:hypothetical protein PM082_021387 [Marasmius tenuissimus]|nr:hypothetical protein PM082_021387 [Marasmius tenuissimus]